MSLTNFALPEYIRYVGRMKQPLQKMDAFSPSMFALSDPSRVELCLIILTPGIFCHAYNFIKKNEAKIVKIFFPSLRPEFISDVMNLYMSLKDLMPVKWVFPETYNHYSFSMGHERCGVYIHPADPQISIEYIKKEKVDRLYDILVRCEEGQHYFSLHMTDEKCSELFYCKTCTFIHVPKSAPIYGGMCYDSLFSMNKRFARKLVPFDFTSLEEYWNFKGNVIHTPDPEPPKKKPCNCEGAKEKDKWYPGHPPLEIDGSPGRPVESDYLEETPKGDGVYGKNDTIQGSE